MPTVGETLADQVGDCSILLKPWHDLSCIPVGAARRLYVDSYWYRYWRAPVKNGPYTPYAAMQKGFLEEGRSAQVDTGSAMEQFIGRLCDILAVDRSHAAWVRPPAA